MFHLFSREIDLCVTHYSWNMGQWVWLKITQLNPDSNITISQLFSDLIISYYNCQNISQFWGYLPTNCPSNFLSTGSTVHKHSITELLKGYSNVEGFSNLFVSIFVQIRQWWSWYVCAFHWIWGLDKVIGVCNNR